MNDPDTHCHLSCHPVGSAQDLISTLQKLKFSPRTLNVMSTYIYDLEHLETMVDLDADQIIVPFLGIHPWYSHLFSIDKIPKEEHYSLVLSFVSQDLILVLPDPIPLDSHLQKIEELAEKFKRSGRIFGIGEIGLDKIFKIPSSGYFGNVNYTDVSLTKSKVSIDHQLAVFCRQMELADRLKVPVSLHCVKAHGPLYDTVARNYIHCSNVILHSYSGSGDQAQRWVNDFKKLKRKLSFSFSDFVNGKEEKNSDLKKLVLMLHQSQILLESDIAIDEIFLNGKKDSYLAAMSRIELQICHIKGWDLNHGRELFRDNSLVIHLSIV